jgi:hypothetical protein
MTLQVYPKGGGAPVPRNLAGSLILHKPGGARRVVVRDDGDNGLWISHPGDSASMYFITRAEYDRDWVFEKHEGMITREEMGGRTFDDRKGPEQQDVDLNHRNKTVVAEQETTDMPSEPTDREAMAREILDKTPIDATTSGRPVGANEEPANMAEEDRMDADAEAAKAEEAKAAPRRSRKSAKDEDDA